MVGRVGTNRLGDELPLKKLSSCEAKEEEDE